MPFFVELSFDGESKSQHWLTTGKPPTLINHEKIKVRISASANPSLRELLRFEITNPSSKTVFVVGSKEGLRWGPNSVASLRTKVDALIGSGESHTREWQIGGTSVEASIHLSSPRKTAAFNKRDPEE